jgi:phosphoenolpyruvate-protein kinase (PTS system EI component)
MKTFERFAYFVAMLVLFFWGCQQKKVIQQQAMTSQRFADSVSVVIQNLRKQKQRVRVQIKELPPPPDTTCASLLRACELKSQLLQTLDSLNQTSDTIQKAQSDSLEKAVKELQQSLLKERKSKKSPWPYLALGVILGAFVASR